MILKSRGNYRLPKGCKGENRQKRRKVCFIDTEKIYTCIINKYGKKELENTS